MARDPNRPGWDASTDTPDHADETEGLVRLLEESKAAEAFDPAAEQRFGKLISETATMRTKRRRQRPPGSGASRTGRNSRA